MYLGFWCVFATCLWTLCSANAGYNMVCREELPGGVTKRCKENADYGDVKEFEVDGWKLTVKFKNNLNNPQLQLTCHGNLTLGNSALPHFSAIQRFDDVKLENCSPPIVSYAQALLDINVHAIKKLEIKDVSEITREHLAGLEYSKTHDSHRVETLALLQLRIAQDAFNAVPNLLRLRLQQTNFSHLEHLPTSLKELHFVNAAVQYLPGSVFSRLENLFKLTLTDYDSFVTVGPSKHVQEMNVAAKAVKIDFSLSNNLTVLDLTGWNEITPERFKSCVSLQHLYLKEIAATYLPDDWLTECHSLVTLSVKGAPSLTKISKHILRGVKTLGTLEMKKTALTTLPLGLLDDQINLTSVLLSDNKINSIESSFFILTKEVKKIDLKRNNLTNSVFQSLFKLKKLEELDLSHNPRLGDACRDKDGNVSATSDLNELRNLKIFKGKNTSTTVICYAWRRDMQHLRELDLSDNRITELKMSDLQFDNQGQGKISVYLTSNPLTRIRYDRKYYYELTRKFNQYCLPGGNLTSRARVYLSNPLICDCDILWAAKSIRNCPENVNIENAICKNGDALNTVPIHTLTCPTNCSVPADCQCARRDDEARQVYRVTCANRTSVPSIPYQEKVTWELILPNNNITHIKKEDLPRNLQELDLRNNILRNISDVVGVLRRGAKLLLKGNMIKCDCKVTEAILYSNITIDESNLLPPKCNPCKVTPSFAKSPLLTALLVPLAVSAIVVLFCIFHSETRRRLKKLILNLFCPPSEPISDLPYDVFLSYSHLDADLVEQLMNWLENNEYKVIEHSRDWAPGVFIPQQISASVAKSRCTLVVVSKNFLNSKWARAEFREAYVAALHDTQPRLVVVLLEEPAKLPLDKELRRYLKFNTYALWTDQYFWRKLRAALPKPRPCIQAVNINLAPTSKPFMEDL